MLQSNPEDSASPTCETKTWAFQVCLFESEHTEEMCQQGRLLTACSVLHVQFNRARIKASAAGW